MCDASLSVSFGRIESSAVSFFKQDWLKQFAALEYQSKSHTFNKAVIAAYYNVKKYGFEQWPWGLTVRQSKRIVNFVLKEDDLLYLNPDALNLSEHAIFRKKTKEVCYDLEKLFSERLTAIKRGIGFSERADIEIDDYKKDVRLDLIYNGWKQTKEANPKTFLMTFNPARYYRSYELLDHGFDVYQKIVLVKKHPYALINFALQGEHAFELSFLSLYKDPELKLINDQNDCIIVNCLFDLYKLHNVKYVNLGTDAGIKGLKFFKHKLPNFEQVVYQS